VNGEKKDSEKVSDLRKRTEDALQGKNEDLKGLSTTDARSLVSELQVHQTELEMQNEELRKAKKELEDVRNSYSDLYDFAPVGYFTFDKNGLIYKMNLTSAAKLGMERGFLIKKPFSNYISKSSKDVFYSHLHQVFNTGKRQTCEIKLQDKKGIEFDAQLETIPEQEIEGNINRCKTIVIDITERKRAEKAAEELGRYAESIVETVREPLLVMDANLNIISASRNFYKSFKTTPEDTIGKFIYDLGNHQWDIPALRTLLEDILPKETKFENFEVKHDFQTLGNKTMLLNAREIRREDIGTKTILLAIEDITERKRMEEKLEKILADFGRSNVELEQFAYVASHDLQEPLRMVTSFTQLLEKRYKNKLDRDADEFIGFIVDGALRMQSMINDLLQYSRIGTRGKPFIVTDFESILNQALINLKVTIEENNAIITHDPLPTLMADPSQMTQVFQNLLSNAIKFRSKEMPRVHVSAQKKEKKWIFSLRDNGIGIAPEFFEKLFILFQRLHSKSEYPGTGIGLAVCKKIVERHGGKIWVESETGKGSTFYFTIPVSQGEYGYG
jgi:PAS domain S-box-containing protein